MNFNTVDLEKELQKQKKQAASKNLLSEVNELLEQAQNQDQRVLDHLQAEGFDFILHEQRLDDNHIYSHEQIRKLCIKYRLRFLDSSVFKGEIPYEAIAKIKQLEKELEQPLKNFKVVAPKELFKLEDKDSDPLLFLELANGRYYLIHKWGGELNRFRSLLAFPLRDFMSMFWFLLGVAVLFAWLVPTPSWHVMLFLIVHSFIAVCGLACMLVMGMRENFSSTEWDSKYFS
ncbi:MAG: hypothetical protein RIC95_01585 [Vicingaceae bacterium]